MSRELLLQVCMVVYAVVITLEFVRTRQVRHFLRAVGAGVLTGGLAVFVTQASLGYVAFGAGGAPWGTVSLLGLATMLGIVAQYIFYLQPGHFAWFACLKPLTITPIVLLPLMGSVQGLGTLNAMQVTSFTFLAFQNGFFWQTILASARPQP